MHPGKLVPGCLNLNDLPIKFIFSNDSVFHKVPPPLLLLITNYICQQSVNNSKPILLKLEVSKTSGVAAALGDSLRDSTAAHRI